MLDTGVDEQVSYGRCLTLLAEAAPDETAIVFAPRNRSEETVSWGDFERRSNQAARLLIASGVGVGDTVVVGLPNSPELLFVLFGAWKLGATVLPLRHDMPAWERERILDLVVPAAVVGDWPDAPGGVVTTADLAGSTALEATALPDRIPTASRLLASSGSTGRPKVIVSPSPGVVSGTPSSLLAGDADMTYLAASPLYHANGFASSVMPLLMGNRVVLMEAFDAAHAVELIESHRVNFTIMVPTMLMRIARLPDVGSHDFSSLERVLSGGAAIPDWVVRSWLNLVAPEHFWFSYGSSEGVGMCVATGEQWLERPGTSGQPVNCDIQILDADRVEVPVGEVGEIFLRPHEHDDVRDAFTYLGVPMPEITADGFVSIGDMGSVDGDGFLFIADRRHDLIVTGGANVFPAEVEAALTEHHDVADAVVVGLADPEWGQRVHAIVELVDPMHLPTDEELRRHCKDRLSSYKAPKTFEIIDVMPRTSAGKVNRSALAAARAAPGVEDA